MLGRSHSNNSLLEAPGLQLGWEQSVYIVAPGALGGLCSVMHSILNT